jgi:hypothetical protein
MSSSIVIWYIGPFRTNITGRLIAKGCPPQLPHHCINSDCPLRCASLAAGYAARWAALVEAVADCFAAVVSCGMERHETPQGKPCCTTMRNQKGRVTPASEICHVELLGEMKKPNFVFARYPFTHTQNERKTGW